MAKAAAPVMDSASIAKAAAPSVRRLVVKIGTSTLTDDAGRIDVGYISALAGQVACLTSGGTEVVVVTSGAIIAGLESLGMPLRRPDDIPTLQAAAAIGQVELARRYADAFQAHGLLCAQILLTRHDIESRDTYLHARETLLRLIELGAICVINENDTVAVDEIRFGDNDTLAAQVAMLIKADLVVVLSDIDGLYSADPRLDEDARLIEQVASFSAEIVAAAGSAGTSKGSGGMATKLDAARFLMAAGIPMVICQGRRQNALIDAAGGTGIGTRFAKERQAQAPSRKLWRALAGKARGAAFIDDGAVAALRERGGSLLPVGVMAVEGEFTRGAVIDIRSAEGLPVGRGISRYDSQMLRGSLGKRSGEVRDSLAGGSLAGDSLAGESNHTRTEVIHRDEMVVF
jgi:glutamate 5-kinase